ncbi:MAG: Hsp33 family molecular chaperone HslO [Lachnospiraceae bacterium]|nr:Hsp33 family molecular chaperone HslO [Lachnospiraceae bacterium]
MDYKIRATAQNDTIRAFAITARETVEEARQRHDTSPVISAALGRMLCGASMMSMMEKEEENLLTLQVIGDGPVGGITVSASPGGLLKGFANVSRVDLPPKYKGKLDVGTAVGQGILRVLRDTGAPEPYVGTVALTSGEIGDDLTYYFAQSEQTPSAVGLGVLVDTDWSIACAGGFIVQLMPDATEETIEILERNLADFRPVTEYLSEGRSPEDLLELLLKDLSPSVLEKKPVAYQCDCSRKKVIRSLISLGQKDLGELAQNDKPTEVRCDFCNRTYSFSPEELRTLMKEV